ncbi:MAG: YbaK/EbsC family protein [Chloroflexota bacterium]
MGAVERVRQRLAESGLDIEVIHLDKDTRTAELAAQALDTAVGAIVKSLVFIADGETVVALVAGDKRADAARLAGALAASEAQMARAALVKQRTGYAIGGVPPFVEDDAGKQVRTLMDESLYRYQTVYAAAGSPFDIFPVAPDDLRRLTGATVLGLAEE